mgnify:CR=1 FL=1
MFHTLRSKILAISTATVVGALAITGAASYTIARTSSFGTFEAIVGCVAAGMGVSLVPRAIIGGQLAGTAGVLRVHPVPDDVAWVTTVMIWHKARSRQPAREAFAGSLAAKLGEYGALQ